MEFSENLVESTESHERTRFGVSLFVDMDKTEIEKVGSPLDWNWDRLVDKGIGGTSFTNVTVDYVTVESTFCVNDDGDVIQETTYDLVKVPIASIEKSFDMILGFAQDYIADTMEKTSVPDGWQKESLQKLIDVRDFARDHFGNSDIGDSGINDFIRTL